MLAIILSTIVSLALLAFALAVIEREVSGNWAAIRAALRGEPARGAFVPTGPRTAARRALPVRLSRPVPARMGLAA